MAQCHMLVCPKTDTILVTWCPIHIQWLQLAMKEGWYVNALCSNFQHNFNSSAVFKVRTLRKKIMANLL